MTDERDGKGDDNGKLLYCSFCGKSQHEVRKLIAGPSVFICDECVDLCNDIIREEVQEESAETSRPWWDGARRGRGCARRHRTPPSIGSRTRRPDTADRAACRCAARRTCPFR